jgi:rhodanese-related sulfurtransferase
VRQSLPRFVPEPGTGGRAMDPVASASLRAYGLPAIDGREPAAFAAGGAPGAASIRRAVLEFEAGGQRGAALSNRHPPVVLCCRRGGRPVLAAEALLRLGFSQLPSAGGFMGGSEAGRAVQGGDRS